MHLAEGVLGFPTLITAAACTAVGVTIGMRRLTTRTLPIAALFAAVFFLIGTIHIPVGLGSVHLVLNGLIGLLLGWLAFPVILIALSLQALLFSFGGFFVLGANTLLLAAPAVLVHYTVRPLLKTQPTSSNRQLLAGSMAATIGIGGATLIAALMLWSTGQDAFNGLIGVLAAAQLPVWLIDTAVSALVVTMLARALPEALSL